MFKSIIFKRAFLALIWTGFINIVAIKLYLYWTIPWIDMVVHCSAGVTVALATIWLCSLRFDVTKWSTAKLITIALMGTIFIGILWELFELHFGITALSDGIYYIADTGSDLIMDTIGGLLGSVYALSLFTKFQKNGEAN